MESSKKCVLSSVSEKPSPPVERTLSIKIVHNYVEKSIVLSSSEDFIETIKRKAHELFSLTCVRLELDRKPLVSASQLFALSHPKVLIYGVKNKCGVSLCNISSGTSISIYCKFCSKSFCSKHTMPEEHLCEQISICIKESVLENSKNLLSQLPKR